LKQVEWLMLASQAYPAYAYIATYIRYDDEGVEMVRFSVTLDRFPSPNLWHHTVWEYVTWSWRRMYMSLSLLPG
jgi:hypothetical protein